METLGYFLVNSLDNPHKCETIIESFYTQPSEARRSSTNPKFSFLSRFLSYYDNSLFRSLFHINKETVNRIANEIKLTKTFRISVLLNYGEEDIIYFICVSVLYINSNLSLHACSLFSGYAVSVVVDYVNLFNKIMNELKDRIIRFPALSNQGLLKADHNHFFPGAVGVIGMIRMMFYFIQ